MAWRKQLRVKWHDYGAGGWYFITICTPDMEPIFGRVVDGICNLNQIGLLVEAEWNKTFTIRNDARVGIHQVMPNHFHALVGIDDRPGLERKSTLPKIMNAFKGAATRRAKMEIAMHNIWQRNYHEHIVRNEEEWNKIANYIYLNPQTWEEDQYYKNQISL